jgi:hypothetical protein
MAESQIKEKIFFLFHHHRFSVFQVSLQVVATAEITSIHSTNTRLLGLGWRIG